MVGNETAIGQQQGSERVLRNTTPQENGLLVAFGLFVAALVCIQCVVAIAGWIAPDTLANDFAMTRDGEWWRVVTAQLLHLDWMHFIIDASCILCMAGLLRGLAAWGRTLTVFLVGGMVGQAFAAMAWNLGLTDYASLVGSSDGLHGLIYLYIAIEYRRAVTMGSRIMWIAAMGVLAASTVYTCWTGHMPFASMLKSPGYNHWGGILTFLIALECGFFGDAAGLRRKEERTA